MQKSRKTKSDKSQGVLTNADINKLKSVFSTAKDHVNLEDKVDKLTEGQVNLEVKVDHIERKVTTLEVKVDTVERKVDRLTEVVEKLPTKDEIQQMLEQTFGLTKLKEEHDRMKKIFREKFNINIEVEI